MQNIIEFSAKIEIDGDDVTERVERWRSTAEKGVAYEIIELDVHGVKIPSKHIRDGVERITLTRAVNGVETARSYMIDAAGASDEETTHIVGKTAGAKASESYSGRISDTVYGTSSEIIAALYDACGVVVDMDGYTGVDVPGGHYTLEDISIQDAVNDILTITGAEAYPRGGTVVVSDMQSVGADDAPVETFTGIVNIESFDISGGVDDAMVQEVGINVDADAQVVSEPKMVLDVDKSPQPLSPTSTITFTDDESRERYRIAPVSASAKLYYSPLSDAPDSSGHPYSEIHGYRAVDTVDLSDERVIVTRGGIRSILGIEIDGEPVDTGSVTWEAGYDTVVLPRTATGVAKISYETDVYRYVFGPSSDQGKTAMIRAENSASRLRYVHRWEADGYWPAGYRWTLDLIGDWSVDENDAVNASGNILRVEEDGSESDIGDWHANAFGEVEIVFSDYGCYALSMTGYPTLYIQFYANEFSKGPTKVVPK